MRLVSDRTMEYEQYALITLVIFFAALISALSAHKYSTAIANGCLFLGYLLGARQGAGWHRSHSADALAMASLQAGGSTIGAQSESVKTDAECWDGGFDDSSPMYPRELDIAMQAWRAVSNNPTTEPVRDQLEKWLNITYPGLAAAAVERITGVCNWNKAGGRPRVSG